MTKTYLTPPDLFDSRQYDFSQVVLAKGSRTVYGSGKMSWDTNEGIGATADLADKRDDRF
jgi:hypothetical protein